MKSKWVFDHSEAHAEEPPRRARPGRPAMCGKAHQIADLYRIHLELQICLNFGAKIAIGSYIHYSA